MTGVFTLSLDFELLWGTRDLFGIEGFRRACEIEREQVFDRLLALLERHEIPATWCIVGHLFLDRCSGHPQIVPPRHAWCADWFQHDPCSDETRQPLFYGRSLVEKIRSARVPQEIGSHSFSHVIFDDPGCSRDTARTELAACVEAARALGIDMRSFVFPRNAVGHLDVLREHGFTVYRGVQPGWHNRAPENVRRVVHLLEVMLASTPPVVLPERDGDLWNVPASMIFFPANGLRKYIPMSIRVKRALRGLDAAVKQGRVFHLWLHPTNLSDEIDAMFEALDQIFVRARGLADQGKLRLLPMRDVPAAFS
jgi:peptidoglycan/xylan/chitin deacetylase (PgdA/CDA1 family)